MMLSTLGRHQEALAMFTKAEELDPLMLTVKSNAAAALVRARRYDDAVERGRRALGVNPKTAWTYAIIGRAQAGKGRPVDALAAYLQYRTLSPGAAATSAVACGLAMTGRRAEATQLANSLERPGGMRAPSHFWLEVARAYACLAERAHALAALDQAFADRLETLPLINVDPPFDSLRSEPRFRALLSKMNLPPLPVQ
jgi:tetratricopeptide (TPR) repeat protein